MSAYQGVFQFELLEIKSLVDQAVLPQAAQAAQVEGLNRLSVDIMDQACESTLTFAKKAYLDSSLLKAPNGQKSDIVVKYDCDKGMFLGQLPASQAEALQSSSNKDELELELKDMAEVPMFKVKLRVQFFQSNVESQYLPGTIKQGSVTSYLVSFDKVVVEEAHLVAARKRSVQNNEITKSEIILVLQIEKQRVEINIENPVGANKKLPCNSFSMFKNGETLRVTLEERVYKLERDEQAFLESIRKINTNQATSINQFLMQKTGGYGMVQGEGSDLNALMKKKQTLTETKILIQKNLNIEADLITQDTRLGVPCPLQIVLDSNGTTVSGSFLLSVNKFVNMPRGIVTLELVDYSAFTKDQNISYSDLSLKVSKIIGENAEKMTYIMNEAQMRGSEEKPKVAFETHYFDDTLKLDVFHKNSTVKSNMIGKGTLELRLASFDDLSVTPVQVYNKKIDRVVGVLFVKVKYEARSLDLMDDEWLVDLQQPGFIDKFTYFDDYLTNEFKNACHFGFLTIELASFNLPKQGVLLPGDQASLASSQLYMLRIKVGSENNCYYLNPPNRILNQTHLKFFAKTSSLSDKVSIELYHILSEQAFNPDAPRSDFKNQRLLSHELFEVKNIPFDSYSVCSQFQMLMALQNCDDNASFTYNFKYQRLVPEDQLGMPLDSSTNGLLFLKMVQTESSSLHHNKDLEKYQFILDVTNTTKLQTLSKKLYFNKPALGLGFVQMQVGEQINFQFSVMRASSENKDLFCEFQYLVTPEGLKGISDNCKNELIELRSWQPLYKPLALNYNLDSLATMKQPFATTLGGQGGANLSKAADLQVFRTTNGGRGGFGTLNSILGAKTAQAAQKFLIESLCLEFEYRFSDFSILSSKSLLENCEVRVYFDKENVVDLLMSKDISENAYELSNVSSHKRSLRETKTFYLNEMDFETPYSLKLFTINDVLQLKIKDIGETFFTVRLAEIPLSTDRVLYQFFQVGSKQLQLAIELFHQPVEAVKPGFANKLLANIQGGLGTIVNAQKEANAYMEKVRAVNGKPVPEQIKLLKQYINEQETANRQLITKQLRLKKECEKSQKKLVEGMQAKARPARPNVPKESLRQFDVNKMLSGVVISQGTVTDPKSTQQPLLNICGCGSKEPKFKGYCSECLSRLKKEFDRLLEKFKVVQEEYDSYTGVDQSKADEKMRLMRNKIEQYEVKLSENEMIDVVERHEKLSKNEENRTFAEFKVTVQSMKQELSIMKVKQDIELQDLKKQQDYLEMQVAKKQGSKKDLERELEAAQESLDLMSKQVTDIDKRVVLKKRYVLKQQARIQKAE